MPKKRSKTIGPLTSIFAEQFLTAPEDLDFDLNSIGYKHRSNITSTFDLLYTNASSNSLEAYGKLVKPAGFIAAWNQVLPSQFNDNFNLLFRLYLFVTGVDFGDTRYPPENVSVLNVYGKIDSPLHAKLNTSHFSCNISVERNILQDDSAIPFSVSTKILNLLCPKDGTVFDPFPNNGSIARASILSGRETRIVIPEETFHKKLKATLHKTYERI